MYSFTSYIGNRSEMIKIRHLSLRIHSTRHTHADMLLDASANMKFVQERLGHGSKQFKSDVYAHVSKKISARSIDKFEPERN